MVVPSHRDTGGAADRESPPRAPRWVLVLGVIAAVLVLLVLVVGLVGGGLGGHGPGRHTGDGGPSPAVETELHASPDEGMAGLGPSGWVH